MLQANQRPHFRLLISRPDGSWTDASDLYLKSSIQSPSIDCECGQLTLYLSVDNADTIEESIDADTTRDADVSIGSSDDVWGSDDAELQDGIGAMWGPNTYVLHTLSPINHASKWNWYNGEFSPLLDEGREVELQYVITSVTESRPGDADPRWDVSFRGVICSADTEGNPVTIICRDLAKYLMDSIIEKENTYSPNRDKLAEEVINQVIDDWWPGSTPPQVTVLAWSPDDKALLPTPSGWGDLSPYVPEVGKSLWDVCRDFADQHGSWIGYWPYEDRVQRLTMVIPPREKTAADADFKLNWRDNVLVSRININGDGIRNVFIGQYTDATDKLRYEVYPHSSLDAIVVKNLVTKEETVKTDSAYAPFLKSTPSIAARRRRPMWVSEAATSIIDTLEEMVRMGNSLISDLSDYTGVWQVEMPWCPELKLFDVITCVDPMIGLDGNQAFAVTSYEHEISFEEGSSTAITRATCQGKVIGGYTRWHEMEARPGSPSAPIPGGGIKGFTPAVPSNLRIESSGLEAVGQDTQSYVVLTWDRVDRVNQETYQLRVRQHGASWSTAEYVSVPQGLSHKMRLPGGRQYDVQVRCIAFEGAESGWSDEIMVSSPSDAIAPTIGEGITVSSVIGGISVTLNEQGSSQTDWSLAKDWNGAEVLIGTASGFTDAQAVRSTKGKQKKFDFPGLTPGTTYYARARTYDTSGNYSGWTGVVSGVPSKVNTGDIQGGAVDTAQIAVAAVSAGDIYSYVHDAYDESTSGSYVTLSNSTWSYNVTVPGSTVVLNSSVALGVKALGIQTTNVKGKVGAYARLYVNDQPRGLSASVENIFYLEYNGDFWETSVTVPLIAVLTDQPVGSYSVCVKFLGIKWIDDNYDWEVYAWKPQHTAMVFKR